jgi:hypothetical protein
VLDKYNAELFSPNGMYVMIIKYDPTMGQGSGSSSGKGRKQGGLISTVGGAVGSLASSRMGGRDGSGNWSRDYTSGSTGADTLPTEAAPIIFLDNNPEYQRMMSASKSPSPDNEAEANNNGWMKKSGSKASSAMAGLNNYLDKRARANYIAENGENVLTVGDPDAVRRASNNSSPYGRHRGRDRDSSRDEKYEREKRKELEDYDKERRHIIDDRRGRQETEQKLRELDEKLDEKMADLESKRQEKSSGRKISENVLYLMVVNLPSDALMASAEARMDQVPVSMTSA